MAYRAESSAPSNRRREENEGRESSVGNLRIPCYAVVRCSNSTKHFTSKFCSAQGGDPRMHDNLGATSPRLGQIFFPKAVRVRCAEAKRRANSGRSGAP